MKLNKLSTVILALAAVTTFDVVKNTKPAAALGLVGLTDNNGLVLFDSNNPGSTTNVSVTGVDGTLLGIDRRPSNDLVYGLTSTNNIYTINPSTGAASFVSTLDIPFTGGSISGVDFNPVPDRLRVVGANDQNFRINVDTGAVIVDGTLNPQDPNITAVAYTNADNDPTTGTALYDIDFNSDALFIQNPPNDGTLQRVGSLGIDIDTVAGFDIFGVDRAIAALTPDGGQGSNFYNINLNTGAATLVDRIGNSNTELIGLTAIPERVPEPSLTLGFLVGGGVLALSRRCRRRSKSVN